MIEEVQTTAESYDQIAPYYLHLTGMQQEARRITELWVDRFLEAFPVPGFPILDLGCGDGRDLELFHSRGVRSIGMDVSHAMLNYARRRLPKGLLAQMDITSWGWKPRSFGGVWASGIIYHVPKEVLGNVLHLIRKSLVPGGVFYFNYLVGSGEGMDQQPGALGSYPRYYAYYEPREMAQLLRGFQLLTWEHQHRNGHSLRVDHILATASTP